MACQNMIFLIFFIIKHKEIIFVKETIDFRCVFGPDVVVEQKAKGRANEYTLSPQMDMELCHFSG